MVCYSLFFIGSRIRIKNFFNNKRLKVIFFFWVGNRILLQQACPYFFNYRFGYRWNFPIPNNVRLSLFFLGGRGRSRFWMQQGFPKYSYLCQYFFNDSRNWMYNGFPFYYSRAFAASLLPQDLDTVGILKLFYIGSLILTLGLSLPHVVSTLSIHNKCWILLKNPTASSKSYWEPGSQDPPLFPGTRALGTRNAESSFPMSSLTVFYNTFEIYTSNLKYCSEISHQNNNKSL